MNYHLAELNIAKMLAPLDSEQMSGFMNGLAEINALAEAAPGFVWRLTTPAGDATELRPFDDPEIIVNMSVWESIDALFDYTYYSAHTDFFRRRGEWFSKMDTPAVVMWWIPAGHIPTLDEAKEKLEHLTRHGATPTAFTFKQRFPAPEA